MSNGDDEGVQQPSEFMSLTDKIKSYDYPAATENRLIIKMNETGIGYIREYEETDLTKQLGENEINGIIEAVNNICNKVYLKSRTEETKDFNSGLSMMLNWSGGLLLASAITIL